MQLLDDKDYDKDAWQWQSILQGQGCTTQSGAEGLRQAAPSAREAPAEPAAGSAFRPSLPQGSQPA